MRLPQDLFARARRGRGSRRASAVAGRGRGPGAARDPHRRGPRAGTARGARPDAQACLLLEARLRARRARAVPAQSVGGLRALSATELLRRSGGGGSVVGKTPLEAPTHRRKKKGGKRSNCSLTPFTPLRLCVCSVILLT